MSHRYVILSALLRWQNIENIKNEMKLWELKLLQIDFLISEWAEMNQNEIDIPKEIQFQRFMRKLVL